MTRVLHIDGVTAGRTAWFGRKTPPLISDLSLELFGAQIGCLVGEVGPMGEMLARLLLSRTQPRDGRITLEETVLTRANRRRTRHRVAIWRGWQRAPINPHRPVWEAVAEPLEVLLPRLSRADTQAYLAAALEALEIDQALWSRVGAGLTPLEAQRVALARALVTQPAMVLALEPGAGLDPTDRAKLINRMIALKEAGTAILLLTHDLALAEHLA
ncbi:MAG: ATP-binding cassette domain-containing protein, partial [Pseudomonadota bacterium]